MAIVLKKKPMPALQIVSATKSSAMNASSEETPNEVAKRIQAKIASLHDTGASIGRDLIAIKEKIPHGGWGCWLLTEFDMSERTAQNYMRIAKLYDEVGTDIVAELPAGAQYALAAPSTPQGVKYGIIETLKAGGKVTTESVKSQIADAKAKAKVTAKPDQLSKSTKLAEESPKSDAAERAMKLLQEHLGSNFAEFKKLFRKAGDAFAKELRKAGAS